MAEVDGFTSPWWKSGCLDSSAPSVTPQAFGLEEQPRERVPSSWAETQNNLASTLLALGQREGGTARLEQAIAAARAALEQWTRDQTPRVWAFTEKELGDALAVLAQRQKSLPHTEEAIASMRNALEVYQQLGDNDRSSEAQTRLAELETQLAALRR